MTRRVRRPKADIRWGWLGVPLKKLVGFAPIAGALLTTEAHASEPADPAVAEDVCHEPSIGHAPMKMLLLQGQGDPSPSGRGLG